MSAFNLNDVAEILEQARGLGIRVSSDGNELVLKTDQRRKVDPNFLQTLKVNKEKLLTYFREYNDAVPAAAVNSKISARRRSSGDTAPLSFSQERLWFIDQLEGSLHYHMPAALRMKGVPDVAAMEHALRSIVNRHEVLRTVIRQENGVPFQLLLEEEKWQLSRFDGTAIMADPAALQAHLYGYIYEPVNMEHDHMMRAQLITLAHDEYMLVLVIHHIAGDGWSTAVLINELVEHYAAYKEQRIPDLPVLDVQYIDYAVWQRNHLQGEVLEQRLAYWKNKLEGAVALALPQNFERPAVQSNRGAYLLYDIDESTTAALQQLAKRQGVTLYMLLLAAFKVLLHRCSAQDDICIGGAVAGRAHTELEPLIGFFVNTLALRSDLSGNPAFNIFLQQVKNTLLDAYEHQDVPFGKVVEAVVKERDQSRNPLFNTMFVFQNVPAMPDLRIGDVVITKEPLIRSASFFDLTWVMEEKQERISIYLEYNTALFIEDTVQRMYGHYETLLQSILKDPAQPVRTLEILRPAEKRQLIETFNATATDYPSEKTIVDLFIEQATLTPDAVAVAAGPVSLTYRELQVRAGKLANYLRNRGIQEGALVPLCIERSTDLITGVLGVLMAGGAYVPVDPSYPRDRIRYMLEDTGSTIIVTTSLQQRSLREEVLNADFVTVDELPEILSSPSVPSLLNLRPESPAYVMYTSGSTGRPKGVVVTHCNVTSLAKGGNFLEFNVQDVLLSTGSSSFDATTIEYWGMLLNGGQLVLCDEKRLLDNQLLKQEIHQRGVTKMWFTASWFNQLIDDDITIFEGLKAVMVGGEKLSEEHVRRFIAAYPATVVINGYGPTENTTFSLTFHVREVVPGKSIPIGRPLGNRTAYILDSDMQPLPLGVPGELYVGGAGVSLGYLKQPELTTEKFVADPFSTTPGARLYRTGDRARRLVDGTVEYLGRIDDQVKIRGYRIEPGEIESVLLQHEDVRQAVVLMNTGDGDGKYLVAFIVSHNGLNKEGLLDYLRGRLPVFLIPSRLVEVEKIPLTSNGKADRKALLALDTAIATIDYTAPANETEEQLAAIWERLLRISPVSTTANFFELGGHSLLVTRVVAAIRETMQAEITISAFFAHPTIVRLATLLSQKSNGYALPDITAGYRPSRIPLSYSQERLWFLDQLNGTVAYHVPMVVRLKGALNRNALAHALRTVVNRHEVLRTVILQEQGKPYQHILDENEWQLGITDDAQYHDQAKLKVYLTSLLNKPFNLAEDHMLRADLISQPQDEHVLLITMHHIASDGWSVSVFLQEVLSFYNIPEIQPDPLPVQFADYAVWQRDFIQGEWLENKLAWWKQQLSGAETLQLPTDLPRPAVQSNRGAAASFTLDRYTSEKIYRFTRQQEATLFMTLLAAFKVLLHRYSGQDDICIGSSIAGRTRAELAGAIGFFVNTLALRSNLGNNPSFASLVQKVKETTLAAYDNQEVPFEKVVEEVMTERDLSRSPLFQVLFELQNTPDLPALQMRGLQLSPESVQYNTTQFDLIVSMEEKNGEITAYVEYCTDLFHADTINRMMRHFGQLLESAVAEPLAGIDALNLLGEEEKTQLLFTFNNTFVAYPHEKTFIDLFTQQAVLTPDRTALVMGKESLSYQEVEMRTNQIAHYLIAAGVEKESIVPLCIGRSLDMVLCIIGIMKAGAAYLPIDPAYPAERINYLLEDSRAKVLVSNSHHKPSHTYVRVISLDEEAALISDQPSAPLTALPVPAQLAYVIYTSGSTGQPKGAMIEHAGMLNHLFAKVNDLEINEDSIVAFTASYTFDISVWQMLSALLRGGKTIICSADDILEPTSLLKLVHAEQVTILEVVPSYLAALLVTNVQTSPEQLQYLLVTGETVPRQVLAEWFNHEKYSHIPVVNAYGPTEASDDITHHFMYTTPESINVPLGKPVQNLHIRILDASMQLCPVGVPGEICVAGIGVGRGYINRPELTAEKFIKDPFSENAAIPMYRTGDLGRWLPDGTIEHLGRIDNQVKVRGYRIELGEIERVIEKSGMIKQVVVITRADSNNQKQLVGYVTPQEHYTHDAMQAWLKDQLPEYMVPAALVTLEQMPLSANGKIDRKALPDVDAAAAVTGEYVAPTNELEEKLEAICSRLLEAERVSINENLFELGMHSLLVMRLAAIVQEDFGMQVSVRTFFQLPTIEALAKYIAVNNVAVAPSSRKKKTIVL
ncbi:MAG TPA: amino acid adenylation domain-containing protein [Chitinophaga sp.]|uniref:non-ribosomal peptide synthetase n=1 Tax=Chitinophaga sp. TaxID=1869181 RepID=UPI002D093245|nr:non-ribosomal peptide synthetase [Chitinophaga sp.]HVI46039.1 amino acid adenylation domain-containing protein [Chitinophaga sp.]